MAVEIHRTPPAPPEPRPRPLRAVPAEASRRAANVVHVHRLSSEDGWTCRCLCGWTSRRLHLHDEAQARSAAAMHRRICRLLQH